MLPATITLVRPAVDFVSPANASADARERAGADSAPTSAGSANSTSSTDRSATEHKGVKLATHHVPSEEG